MRDSLLRPKALVRWFNPRFMPQTRLWLMPGLYILAAILLSQAVALLPGGLLGDEPWFSHATATTLLSAIATGMITFTGFVFSMVFVLIQAGNTTYSPRLSSLFLYDKLIHHALGVFIATFVYALLAITMADRLNAGGKMDYAILITLAALVSSMIMFLGLVQRLSLLQIVNVLKVVGDQTYASILRAYPYPYQHPDPTPTKTALDEDTLRQVFYSQKVSGTLLWADLPGLMRLAQEIDGILMVEYAVGDTIARDAPFVRVYNARRAIHEDDLSPLLLVGTHRDIEVDPNYGMRLIVDIALRALSTAVNDPATAVQALDQLDGLLRTLGQRQLGIDEMTDDAGKLRLVYPASQWEDFLSMAVDEIRLYGERSLQVMRRLRALLEDLQESLPDERKLAVINELEHVDQSIRLHFDRYDQVQAMQSDRQGIGVSREPDNHEEVDLEDGL